MLIVNVLHLNYDNDMSTSDVSAIIKKAGMKVTPGRRAVLNLFSTDCKPINAEFICKKLKNQKINQVTIYRTLFSFEQAGILSRIDLRKGSVHYELHTSHHHHLICSHCGIIERFAVCEIKKHSKKILKDSSLFKSINHHSLELFGLCRACAEVTNTAHE